MVPAPMSVGLTLCHYAAIEEGTRNITLAGSFISLRTGKFPFRAAPFSVFASLVGGQGEGTLELVVTRLQTDQELFSVPRRVVFRDRFTEFRVLFRVKNCGFPAAGEYLFTLLVDGEWMAQRRLLVSQ